VGLAVAGDVGEVRVEVADVRHSTTPWLVARCLPLTIERTKRRARFTTYGHPCTLHASSVTR